MTSERTWKCPECGNTVQADYDWLAEHGNPVCDCDTDMKLLPAVDDAGVFRLAYEKLAVAGVESEDVDEMIHELYANTAADVNNGGLEDQIRCLLREIGEEATMKQLDEFLADRQKTED